MARGDGRFISLGLVAIFSGIPATSRMGHVLAQSAANQRTITGHSAGIGGRLPLAPLRTLTFTVDEGTQMSVDISPDGRLLTFDILGQIFIVPLEGGAARQLTTGPAFAEWPTFSRDGRFIRFSSDVGDTVALWRVPVAGGPLERVPPTDTVGVPFIGRGISSMSWPRFFAAPGGRYRVSLADTMRTRCTGRYLDITDTETKTTRRLPRIPSCGGIGGGEGLAATGTAFTPDGRTFLMAWGGKLRRVELATGTVRVIPFTARVTLRTRPLTRFPHPIAEDSLVVARRIEYPRVSPDGRQLVFGALDRLWLLPLAGGSTPLHAAGLPRRLTSETGELGEFMPVWAPDGKAIAFVTWTDSARLGGAIHRVLLDGTGRPGRAERLTPVGDTAHYSHLSYTADGQQLVAVRSVHGLWKFAPGGAPQDPHPEQGHLAWIDAAGSAVATAAPLDLGCYYDWAGNGRVITAPAARPGAVLFPGPVSKDRNKQNMAASTVIASVVSRPLTIDSAAPASPVVQVRLSAAGVVRCPVILPSPIGDRALVWSGYRMPSGMLHLVDVPPSTGGTAPTVVIEPGAPGVRSLITSLVAGADFPNWAPDGRSFTYAFGRTLYRYDLARADALVRDSVARAGTRRAVTGPAYRPDSLVIRVTQPRDQPRGTLAFRNARLIALNGLTRAGAVIEEGDLVVRDRRIVALGPSGTVAIPPDAHVIDATGKTIMPGLVDVHNHIQSWPNIHRTRSRPGEANLAYGVLTSREPGAGGLDMPTYEDGVATGALLGPRIFGTGKSIDMDLNLADAQALMQRYAEIYGVKYIKSYGPSQRSAQQYLVMAAAERGLNVVAHSDVGDRQLIQNMVDGYGGYDHFLQARWPLYADVHALLVRTGITLAHFRNDLGDAKLYYFMPRLDSTQRARVARYSGPSALKSLESNRRYYEPQQEKLGVQAFPDTWTGLHQITRLAAAGAHMALADHGDAPGFGTHFAMWMLVESGMPILDALRTGTVQGAEALGMDRDLGTLAVGKLADLIVLDRNPLERIEHTLTIRSVLFNGRLYDHATLNEVWPRLRARPPAWWEAATP